MYIVKITHLGSGRITHEGFEAYDEVILPDKPLN
jgi:hypothetical protein